MLRRFIAFLMPLCVLCVLVVCAPAHALEGEPQLTEATAACVMDSEGNVLWGMNQDEILPPASITKIMTAMVAIDSGIPLDEPITLAGVELVDVAQVAGYVAGDVVTFGELLRVTLIYSANDAAVNLAYAVAGSEEAFAELMNEKAQSIGLTNTHFMNSHGLEQYDHHSTAHDLCVMARYAMENYPLIRECVVTPKVTTTVNGNSVTFDTSDALMGNYDGLRGIKTGRTEGGTSFLSSARRDGVTLYGCILCCDTLEGRFTDTTIMLDWAFSQYQQRTLAHGSWTVGVAPWQDGFWLSCPISATRDTVAKTLPETEISYTSVMTRPDSYSAGNSTYGTTVWSHGDHRIAHTLYRTTKPQQTSAWNPLVAHLFAEDEEATA